MPTLLIIRPSNRPQQDIQTCHAAGWQAQVLSPIEIEADRSALKKLPEQFKQADVVFWVSPTAIETAAPHLDFSDGPQSTHYRRTNQPTYFGTILPPIPYSLPKMATTAKPS